MHLWRVSSVSSAPLLEPDDDDEIEEIDAPGISGSGGEAADIRVSTGWVSIRLMCCVEAFATTAFPFITNNDSMDLRRLMYT